MNINDILTNTNFLRRSVIGIGIFFITLAFISLFYIIWQWHDDWVLAHAKTAAPPHNEKVTVSEQVTTIPAEHLFGQSLSKTGAMPVSSLQMRVTGIVKVDSDKYGSFSKAFISISDAPSKVYQIGDKLPDGIKIYDITADAVILENEGRLEKLPLPRESLKFKPKSSIKEHS